VSDELCCIEQKLSCSIDWNRARIKFLARFLVAIITVKTVCLTQVASVFPGKAQPDSAYKRIRRFLADFELDMATIARLVVSLVGQEPPWVLALDRTNWKLGKSEINILMLSLVYKGISFPLLWQVLGKAGNSNTRERIEILERFVTLFGKEKIAYICADREFASVGLLHFLVRQGISYRLRLKGDTLVENGRGQRVRADWLFRSLALEREQALSGLRWCLGQRLFVVGMRLRGDYLIVISDRAASLGEYALRWGIETLFGCLKSRGFNLEATHVTEEERLSKLLALLSLAFVWAYATGAWLWQQRPPRLKKHGRAAVSVFRLGFDWLRRLLAPLAGWFRQGDFQTVVGFLSGT
jgi:hypothetical protein